jgi:hypothetical protein
MYKGEDMKKISYVAIVIILMSIPAFAEIWGSVSGKVTDEITKQGILNVEVLLYTKKWVDSVLINKEIGDYTPRYQQKTNDKGEFKFPMVKQEQYYIVFEPPAPYYDEKNIYIEGCIKADVIGVCLYPKMMNVFINKTLKKGVSISGKVNVLGDTLDFGMISIISKCGNFKPYDLSGTNIEYRVSGLIPIDNNSVSFVIQMKNKSGTIIQYEQSYNHVNLTNEIEKTGMDFYFDFNDPTGIAGQIVDSDNNPVQNCKIDISGYDENGEEVVRCSNSRPLIDGNFIFPGLLPKKYSIYVLKDAKIIGIRKVQVEKGKQFNIRIVVDEKKNSFFPQIKQSQGKQNTDNSQTAKIVSGRNCDDIDKKIMEANAEIAYYGAREKILNDCFGDSVLNCIAKRGLNKVKRVFFYCDEYCHGSGGNPGGDYIKLSGNANAFCKPCIFENITLHEILHVGFGDISSGNEEKDDPFEKRAEACANRCYSSECQIHYYKGNPEDCNCIKDDKGDCSKK